MVSSKKDLAKFLQCCSLFEERVAKSYERMAELVEDKQINCLLIFIARDSFKHADCLKRIGELLYDEVKVSLRECEDVLGKIWSTVTREMEEILKKKEMKSEDLLSVINGLERIEGLAAEEYLTVLQIRLFELTIDELKIDTGYLKSIFEWIIEDEKRHESILRMISKLV